MALCGGSSIKLLQLLWPRQPGLCPIKALLSFFLSLVQLRLPSAGSTSLPLPGSSLPAVPAPHHFVLLLEFAVSCPTHLWDDLSIFALGIGPVLGSLT